MTISQIPGATMLRRNQFGVQTLLNTKVAATRRVPWRGAIEINPNWTDPDADFGSFDPVAPPYPGALEITSTKTGQLYYNDLPLRLQAGLFGGVSPTGGGAAKTWDWQLNSLASDVFDVFTNEFGDDTEATDGLVGIGGLIDSLEETSGTEIGPWSISDQWVYSTAQVSQNLTDSLVVDDDGILVMNDETELKMDSTYSALGTTKMDGLHEATLRVQNNIDRKRFMNGSNAANQLGGYGRGQRVIELVLTVAKTSAWVTEAGTLLTRPKPKRFMDLVTTAVSEAQSGIPYSYRRRGAFRIFSRAETEIGGNAAMILTYRAFRDSDLGYAFRATVVNTQTTVVAPPA